MNSFIQEAFSYLNELRQADYLHPYFLLFLIPLFVGFIIALAKNPRRLWVSLCRFLSFAIILIALSQPVTTISSSERRITALLDLSGSITPSGRTAFLEMLSPFLRDGNSLQILPFSQLTAPTLKVDKESEISKLNFSDTEERVNPGETNLEAALDGILTSSDSSSVLLLSDGFETAGSAKRAATRAQAAGVRIYPLIPTTDVFSAKQLAISSVLAPLTADSGAVAELRTAIRNNDSNSQTGFLDIFLDDNKLYSEPITVSGNTEKLFSLKTPELSGGLKHIRAELRTGAQGAKLAERSRWISVKEKEKVLLLSGSAEDERVLGRLIPQLGYSVENIVASKGSSIPGDFSHTAVVILNNVARAQLPDGFLVSLEKFVREGGGLLTVGGDQSYGLGGYIDTPLENISPVKFVPPQTKKRRINSAVALVIDKSRSMVFQDKILAAKKAALSSIYSLKDDDLVGVIGFDDTPFVIIRLSPVAEVKSQAESRLRNLTARGRTNLLPALALARNSLKEAKAGRRHIIILTDGKLPLAGNAYFDEIAKLRELGVTVSTVALGVEADVPFLKLLSKYGKGAFYNVPDPNDLPDIFIQDIKVATGEETLKEQEDYQVRVSNEGLDSTSISLYPNIQGFVKTLPKKGARLELVTQDEQSAYPVLSSWNVDKGRVVAFTSDANGRWSKNWLPWQGFSEFWREVIESLKTKTVVKQVDFDLRYALENKTLTLDLAIYDEDLSVRGAPQIAGEATSPDGTKKALSFYQTKKGRFAASIENAISGDYRLDINYGQTKLPPVALTIANDAFGEKQGKGINVGFLAELAQQTGGLVNPLPDQVSKTTRITEDRKQLFGPLLAVVFFLIILEAFIRELSAFKKTSPKSNPKDS